MPDWNRAANEIFLSLAEVPLNSQPQLLERLCGSDEYLKAEVRS